MRRVLFYRLYDVVPARLAELEKDARTFARSRAWRGDAFWLASEHSTHLFAMEYFPPARAILKDADTPPDKLRQLDIRQGRLPSGMPIEDVLAARPVIKKMEGEPITFYPPTYRPNSYFRRDKPGMWGFSLKGIRDFAPSFLEAEAEAMRIYRGFRQLNP